MLYRKWIIFELVSWVVLLVILAGIFVFWNPFKISPIKESLFYLVFILHAGLFFSLLINAVLWAFRRKSKFYLQLALRQGFLYSLLVTFVLFLQSKRLFSWWNLGLFIIALALMEMLSYFVKHEREN